MAISGRFWTVLLAALLLHLVVVQAQSSSETDGPTAPSTVQGSNTSSTQNIEESTTTASTAATVTPSTAASKAQTTGCENKDDVPLFSETGCISRSAYTGIFLTSIILAGLSFLMLVGFLLMYCIRGSKSSDDVERNGYPLSVMSIKKSLDQTHTIEHVVDSTPLKPPRPRRPRTEHPTKPTDQIVLPSAPYTNITPVGDAPSRPRRPRRNPSEEPNARPLPSVTNARALSPSGAVRPPRRRRENPAPITTRTDPKPSTPF